MKMNQPMQKKSRIFVTGHRGLVGSALIRKLRAEGYENLLTASRQELELRDQGLVDQWFARQRPEFVIHVAGTVGGILANSLRPADFIYDNQMIQSTVLQAAHRCDVQKLLYLGSSCIYPRDCPQPIKEDYLMTGPLEKTNQAYAIAKIAGLFSCVAYRQQHGCNFISAMPTNLYGENDNFELQDSHVLPALMRKFHEAKLASHPEVVVWGTGTPRREFLHVHDLASACLFLMKNYDEETAINVGTGTDVSIGKLAEMIRDVVYPSAKIVFDTEKPDGTPRKVLDVSRLHRLGWQHKVDLPEGIAVTYQWYKQACLA
jgi:GDP-L-fucose synthase